MAFGQVVGQLFYGAYGPIETLGIWGSSIIIAQLMFAAFLVILLDDMLQGGYGIGSGISLFIVANTAENIFWKIFSPVTLSSEFGIEFEGSFMCLVHFLLTKSPKMALYQAFTRTSAPILSSLLGTIVIFFLVIYLQGVKMYIPLIHQHSRGYVNNFKIKLFYTSTMSIILQSMFASKIYELSSLLYSRFGGIYFVGLLGTWKDGKVIGGIAYWISPPNGIREYASLHGLIYTIFVCVLCALFAQFWLVVSRETPR
jgi:protein transport protein SEC61 subunit alpha